MVAAEEVNVAIEATDDLLHERRPEGEVSQVEDVVAWLHHRVPALDEVLVHGLQVRELAPLQADDPLVVEVVIARVMGRHGIYNSRIASITHKVL